MFDTFNFELTTSILRSHHMDETLFGPDFNQIYKSLTSIGLTKTLKQLEAELN